jgi:hypothetical protein
LSIKRKNISFIEDIVEEAFGEVTPKNMEITKLLFDYMLKEIEYNSETIAFHYKYLGLFYQDLKLLKTKLHRVNEEKDYEKHRQIRDRISLIEIISDEKGKVRNKQLSYPLMLERYLRKKFEIINTNASGNGRIPPLHFVAIEKVQNKNFKLHAQNNF